MRSHYRGWSAQSYLYGCSYFRDTTSVLKSNTQQGRPELRECIVARNNARKARGVSLQPAVLTRRRVRLQLLLQTESRKQRHRMLRKGRLTHLGAQVPHCFT